MTPHRLLLAVTALLLAGSALAQGVLSGGVRLDLDTVTIEATYERPTLDFLGVRWGPLLSARARAPLPTSSRSTEASATILAGLGGTVALPGQSWAVQIQVLTRAAFEEGSPVSLGPEFVLVGTTTLP